MTEKEEVRARRHATRLLGAAARLAVPLAKAVVSKRGVPNGTQSSPLQGSSVNEQAWTSRSGMAKQTALMRRRWFMGVYGTVVQSDGRESTAIK